MRLTDAANLIALNSKRYNEKPRYRGASMNLHRCGKAELFLSKPAKRGAEWNEVCRTVL